MKHTNPKLQRWDTCDSVCFLFILLGQSPRLPNTLGLEVFGPQKHTIQTPPQQVFGRLGKVSRTYPSTFAWVFGWKIPDEDGWHFSPRPHRVVQVDFLGWISRVAAFSRFWERRPGGGKTKGFDMWHVDPKNGPEKCPKISLGGGPTTNYS